MARKLSFKFLIIVSSNTFYHNKIESWKYFHKEFSQGIIVKIFQKNFNNGNNKKQKYYYNLIIKKYIITYFLFIKKKL